MLRSFGHFDGGDHLGDDLVGGQAFEVGFGLEEEAMAKDREGGGFNVVGQEVIAAIHASESAGYKEEADDGAGAAAKSDGGPIAGAADEGDHVGVQGGFDTDAGDFLTRGGE